MDTRERRGGGADTPVFAPAVPELHIPLPSAVAEGSAQIARRRLVTRGCKYGMPATSKVGSGMREFMCNEAINIRMGWVDELSEGREGLLVRERKECKGGLGQPSLHWRHGDYDARAGTTAGELWRKGWTDASTGTLLVWCLLLCGKQGGDCVVWEAPCGCFPHTVGATPPPAQSVGHSFARLSVRHCGGPCSLNHSHHTILVQVYRSDPKKIQFLKA